MRAGRPKGHDQLWVSDRWARSWSVTVDGAATDVLGAGFVWRVVRVAAGKHAVVFRYQPFGRPWLFVVSLLVLAAVMVSAVRAESAAGGSGAGRAA